MQGASNEIAPLTINAQMGVFCFDFIHSSVVFLIDTQRHTKLH